MATAPPFLTVAAAALQTCLLLLCLLHPGTSTLSCTIGQQKVNVSNQFVGPIIHLSVDPVTNAEFTADIDAESLQNQTVKFLVYEKIIFENLIEGRMCSAKEKLAKDVYPLVPNATWCQLMGGGSLVCHIRVEHDDGPENEVYYCALSNCDSGRIAVTYTFDIVESPYVAECDKLSTNTVIVGTVLMLVGALGLGCLIMYTLKKT